LLPGRLPEKGSASQSSTQIHRWIVPEHRVPSKQNIIHSAKVASYFSRSEEFGIACHGFTVNMYAVRDRKRKMVSSVNQMYLDALFKPAKQ